MSNMNKNVFINAPFDRKYNPMYEGLLFTILKCGFCPRCAKEVSGTETIRINKILNIIKQCDFGIHDISRTNLDKNKLPRFNMPFELGLFLAAKKFGNKEQKNKCFLVLEKTKHLYQQYISDIAGQDTAAHSGQINKAIVIVRDWLAEHSLNNIPSGSIIYKKYNEFKVDLPEMCDYHNLLHEELTHGDFLKLAAAWIAEEGKPSPVKTGRNGQFR